MKIKVSYQNLEKINEVIFEDTKRNDAQTRALKFAKGLHKSHVKTLRAWDSVNQLCPFKLKVNFEIIKN